MWRSWKFWVGLVAAVAIFMVGARFFNLGGTASKIDIATPPQFIQAEFIDLSRIGSISKYRSGAGHDYAANGETCRSMKHYFTPISDPTNNWRTNNTHGLPPAPDGQNDIPIYSPVDGEVTSIPEEQTPIGKQIWIRPSNAPNYKIRLFHIYTYDNITVGTKVLAGEKIGVIGAQQGTDIAVEGLAPWTKQAVSYFQVMPDKLFAAYIARGATNRDDFIISRAKRDANPLKCNGEQFVRTGAYYDYQANEVQLTGYVEPSY
jgi:hypothetical protein